MLFSFFFFFFFSSRRRHTRFDCDWSSDVCSSNLISPLGHARQVIKIKQGIESTAAKQITGFIRDSKFKVTTQIQGDEVRVNGKSRDELQAVIGAVRAKEFAVAVQFVNFRD